MQLAVAMHEGISTSPKFAQICFVSYLNKDKGESKGFPKNARRSMEIALRSDLQDAGSLIAEEHCRLRSP
jgi:hypothetical protein